MAQAPSIDELLAIARVEFGGRLPAKVEELERLASTEAWPALRVAAHKLRGSAATYGFAEVGATAASIEELLLAAGAAPDEATRDRVARALEAARAGAAHAAGGGR